MSNPEPAKATAKSASSVIKDRVEASIPPWTNDPSRVLDAFWYVGPDGFFANALVHIPLPFVTRGVLIEEASLESV